jgi:hypothetical protein
MSHRLIMALLLCAQLILPASAQERSGDLTPVTAVALPPSFINPTFNNNGSNNDKNIGLKQDTVTEDGFVRVNSRHMSDIVIFTQPKQTFSGRIYGLDWQVTAQVGTVISHKPGGLVLHTGHLLASGGKSKIKVINNDIEILVAENTSCLIDSADGKIMEITALSSGGKSITVKSNRIANNQIELSAGQKIVLNGIARVMPANLANIIENDHLFKDVIAKAKSKDIASRIKAELIEIASHTSNNVPIVQTMASTQK